MKTQAVRIYPSEKGIWRIEVEYDDGKRRWSSLHTRDEIKAKAEFNRLKTLFASIDKMRVR